MAREMQRNVNVIDLIAFLKEEKCAYGLMGLWAYGLAMLCANLLTLKPADRSHKTCYWRPLNLVYFNFLKLVTTW